ncbi:MAG: SigB/SigF/SigG family RNA polymerase sigma factor [Lachnospiraceae bacterium]|nr:SigB/SigF/SigG family RNA polymerase sigma factor [Lachnospiraceae bacterium]MCQ4774854.1 SigB/SigF/SigG family RNA polymerase sigma factor [Lacrimispora saccharolytica]MDD7434881.1 SigB/SigF/SigG family RNA polymerase sigma factor [Lachnospiraceae bacterium]MDY3341617.1 SigB/SigF/SigG family RNA polymerase sigma factor [Lachnospiraceae bacterium]
MDRTLWLIECAHQGDKKAREAAVEENMGLVMHVVKRYQGKTTDMEDLIQIGCIGLLKAVDYFDLNMDVRFSSYAVPMILGEIRRYLRDDGMLKVSRSLKNIAYQTSKTREMLTVQLGREPSIEEIADATGVEREEIIMAMEASAELESLQKSVYQSDGNEICLEDKVEDRRDAVSELMNHVLLENMLKVLDPEEKSLIHMRYYEEMTQSQIAAKMQKTQVQISRMEKKILKKMRLCIKD